MSQLVCHLFRTDAPTLCHLDVQRVFLGLVESAVSPGFLAITTMWYRKEEREYRSTQVARLVHFADTSPALPYFYL